MSNMKQLLGELDPFLCLWDDNTKPIYVRREHIESFVARTDGNRHAFLVVNLVSGKQLVFQTWTNGREQIVDIFKKAVLEENEWRP